MQRGAPIQVDVYHRVSDLVGTLPSAKSGAHGNSFSQNTCAFFGRDRNNCWIVTVCDESAWVVGRGRVEGMMGPGDVYRFRAADMFAQASRNLRPWRWPSFFSKRQIATDKGSCRDPVAHYQKVASTAKSNSNNKFRNKSTIGRVSVEPFLIARGMYDHASEEETP